MLTSIPARAIPARTGVVMAKVRYIEQDGHRRFAVVPMPLWRRALVALEGQSKTLGPSKSRTDVIDQSPGSTIAAWRERNALSQTALAQAAGISKAYLSQIETGARRGSVRALRSIALALGVSLDQLVG